METSGVEQGGDIREFLIRQEVDEKKSGYNDDHGGHKEVRGNCIVLAREYR